MTPDVLATMIACAAGVVIALVESRRAPVNSHIRDLLDESRERIIKLEQEYLAYPTAHEIVSRLDDLERELAKLHAKVNDPNRPDKIVEGGS